MILKPSHGFKRSVSSHNIIAETFLDWLEATSLFAEEEFSHTDIVDYLVEEQLYDSQDFASEFVSLSWTELQRRLAWLGIHSPIIFRDRLMVRQLDWTEVPAHSFCLVVSLGPKYDNWGTRFGPDYNEQGRLFELITKAAMEVSFSGWRFFHTGWSRDNVSRLKDVIDNLVSNIDERNGFPNAYAPYSANDAGVDLVWHLPFADHWGGAPVYLAQCASGMRWADKIHEPDINEWTKFIDFAAVPNKAFSLPFALNEKQLRQQSNRAKGLLLDRYRLLAHNRPEDEWVPTDLREALVTWLEPRIDWIIGR